MLIRFVVPSLLALLALKPLSLLASEDDFDISISHEIRLVGLGPDYIGLPEVSYLYERRTDTDKIRYPSKEFWGGCDQYKAEKPCQSDFRVTYQGESLPSQAYLDSQLVPVQRRGGSYSLLKSDSQVLSLRDLNISDEFYQIGTREVVTYIWSFQNLKDLYEKGGSNLKVAGSFEVKTPVRNFATDYRMIARSFLTIGDKSTEQALLKDLDGDQKIFDGLPFVNSELHLMSSISMTPTINLDKEFNDGEFANLSLGLFIPDLYRKDYFPKELENEPFKVTFQIEIQNSIINRDVATDFSPVNYFKQAYIEKQSDSGSDTTTDSDKKSASDSKSGGALQTPVFLLLGIFSLVYRRHRTVPVLAS